MAADQQCLWQAATLLTDVGCTGWWLSKWHSNNQAQPLHFRYYVKKMEQVPGKGDGSVKAMPTEFLREIQRSWGYIAREDES